MMIRFSHSHPYLLLLFTFFISGFLLAQNPINGKNKFEQLGTILPTPNVYRTASGAPGSHYWQQRVDYLMEIRIDDKDHSLHGTETITYHNNSPDNLTYLWVQLDQNVRTKNSDSYKIRPNKITNGSNLKRFKQVEERFDGGFKIMSVTDADGNPLDYTINKTMMRIDLENPLKTGTTMSFSIQWWYNINNRMKNGGRSGYEYFKEHDNCLYTIAQFYPRMAVYNDYEGWQNKQFLGSGEFTLTYGTFDVKITVPDDHLVAATGTLQNPDGVLTKEQRKRLEKARKSFDDPVVIATEKEAITREKSHSENYQTWHYTAENVRDFAFASSRKFIWDAMAVQLENGNKTMAMSMYPKEGNPLWGKYATRVVAHTLKWYSHYSVPYPYPVAYAIHAKSIGMEYPMICFNFGRPDADGSYSEDLMYAMISVIIHEVGHNFFPMIINSDERQWTWMDEGLNTFVEYLTMKHWDREFPVDRGPAYLITDYMSGNQERMTPIMTNSENIMQFGNNAYAKTSTALNILRETIIGRELFVYAFKTYAERWKFKQPTPADFFRTMEDASGVDLDWFWRGWFYSTDPVDISIDSVSHFTPSGKRPLNLISKKVNGKPEYRFIAYLRNLKAIEKTAVEKNPELKYYKDKSQGFNKDERKNIKTSSLEIVRVPVDTVKHYYEISFTNQGGLVMPIIVQFTFTDGTQRLVRIPAEIWRKAGNHMTKVFPTDKPVQSILLDPFLETADIDVSDNTFPHLNE